MITIPIHYFQEFHLQSMFRPKNQGNLKRGNMMKSILAVLLLIAATSNAAEKNKQLQCGDQTNFNHFTATLDYSSFNAGTGFFVVTDAYIVDGYAMASLQCAGQTLNEINCVGFWFNSPEYIAHVAIKTENGKVVSSHDNLTKSPIAEASAIPCTIN